jgi:hypothetical protein
VCAVEAIGGGAHVSRARMAAAWRRTRIALALYALFPRHTCRLSIFRLRPRTGPSSHFLYSPAPSLARLLAKRTLSCPFSFRPTQTHIRSAPWRCCSPSRVPLATPFHAASVFGALRHHLRPPGYKCHLACLSSVPPPHLK